MKLNEKTFYAVLSTINCKSNQRPLANLNFWYFFKRLNAFLIKILWKNILRKILHLFYSKNSFFPISLFRIKKVTQKSPISSKANRSASHSSARVTSPSSALNPGETRLGNQSLILGQIKN